MTSLNKSFLEQGKAFFSHAALEVGTIGQKPRRICTFDPSKPVCFDLASLTKPLLTAEKAWNLTDKDLKEAFPDIKASVASLATHQSRLKPWINFYTNDLDVPKDYHERHQKILKALSLRTEGLYGAAGLYSDLNYILLGSAIEKKMGAALKGWESGLISFQPKEGMRLSSGFCPLRQHEVKGFVHDENAFYLGGICGHAGLFGTLEDLSLWVQQHLTQTQTWAYCVQELAKAQPTLWGWRPIDPQIGFYRSNEKGFGHYGFTGCALWFVPETGKYLIFLSNRLFSGKRLDPAFKKYRTELFTRARAWLEQRGKP